MQILFNYSIFKFNKISKLNLIKNPKYRIQKDKKKI